MKCVSVCSRGARSAHAQSRSEMHSSRSCNAVYIHKNRRTMSDGQTRKKFIYCVVPVVAPVIHSGPSLEVWCDKDCRRAPRSDRWRAKRGRPVRTQRESLCFLRGRALGALLVAAAGAGGADDNHATAFAAVLVGRHCSFFCLGW